MSISNALGQRSARRTTSATLISSTINDQRSPPITSRRQSSTETKKELRLARISLCIVWLFLFCHVWKLVPTFYSTFIDDSSDENDELKTLGIRVEWPEWLSTIENESHTLITLNSSLNFLIYIVLWNGTYYTTTTCYYVLCARSCKCLYLLLGCAFFDENIKVYVLLSDEMGIDFIVAVFVKLKRYADLLFLPYCNISEEPFLRSDKFIT